MASKSVWPTNQDEIDERVRLLATVESLAIPFFALDDDSGDPPGLIGSAKSKAIAAGNIQASVFVALDMLLGGEDQVTLTIKRVDMTEDEFAAIPVT